ncbi:MAG: response regulator [Chloroflexota bacterium]
MSSIILADDHRVLSEALRLLLETQPDFHVLAESSDGVEALNLLEKYQPDVLIVDLMMPGLSGLEVARSAKRVSPQTRVIVFSMYDAESYLAEALQAGVSGYVLKNSSAQDLIYAIRQVLAGVRYLSPSLNEHAIQAYLRRVEESRVKDAYETLTRRECEILPLAAEGYSNPQIAEKFSLSVRTVEMHRSNLMKKLSLKTQTELVKYAVRRGLI